MSRAESCRGWFAVVGCYRGVDVVGRLMGLGLLQQCACVCAPVWSCAWEMWDRRHMGVAARYQRSTTSVSRGIERFGSGLLRMVVVTGVVLAALE